jgi:hypothetical protein
MSVGLDLMIHTDETACFDDFLREILRCCSLCGRAGLRMWDVVWRYEDTEADVTFAIAMVICVPCLGTSDYLTHIDTLCRQRYGFPLENGHTVQAGRE